jgi:hypothetical protein
LLDSLTRVERQRSDERCAPHVFATRRNIEPGNAPLSNDDWMKFNTLPCLLCALFFFALWSGRGAEQLIQLYSTRTDILHLSQSQPGQVRSQASASARAVPVRRLAVVVHEVDPSVRIHLRRPARAFSAPLRPSLPALRERPATTARAKGGCPAGRAHLLFPPWRQRPRPRRLCDETCPISTGGGTRRVQSVREGGGGGRQRPRARRLCARKRHRRSDAPRAPAGAEAQHARCSRAWQRAAQRGLEGCGDHRPAAAAAARRRRAAAARAARRGRPAGAGAARRRR